jgi:phosphatidylglycerophosphate synthase
MMSAVYWALMPLGKALVRRGVSANMVTATSLVLGVFTGIAFSFGHFGVGAALSALSALGDALDGLVARESGTASDAGETFDAAVDRYNEFFALGGLAIFYRSNGWLMAAVLLALLGSFMVSYSTAKAEALHIEPPRGAMRRPERAVYLTLGAALTPFTSMLVVKGFSLGYQDAPMIAAVVLIGIAANVSAVRRIRHVALALIAKHDRPVSLSDDSLDVDDAPGLLEPSGKEPELRRMAP